jgi:sugar lactone lactonase YvrE
MKQLRRVVRASRLLPVVIMTGIASLVTPATLAGAKPASDVIVLPGATSAEGITVGHGSTFYAGDFFAGDIFRGDLQRGTAELFIDAPEGRMALGMFFDDATGLLFVAGGFTGQGYVYDSDTGNTVATYQFADPSDGPVINDVTVTKDGAWFTNSTNPVLYFVPLTGRVPGAFSAVAVTGPAAELTGDFNLNGIAATADGQKLVVAHSANGAVYTVDPETGASALIEGISVPNVDGIVLQGHQLWAVQNFINQISAIRLRSDLSSGEVERVITSSDFQIPTTAALHGNRLAAVNAKFDTGFPPTADEYEVVIVSR